MPKKLGDTEYGDPISQSEFDFVSQNAHDLGGLCTVLIPAYLFGILSLWISVPLLVLLAGVKEFYWDYKFETTEVRGSSLEDFLHYCLGAGVAVVLVLIKTFLFKGMV